MTKKDILPKAGDNGLATTAIFGFILLAVICCIYKVRFYGKFDSK